MRDKKLIVANFKMNFTIHEASLYVHRLDEATTSHRDVEMVLAAGFLSLPSLSMQVDHRKIKLAAQNFYWRDQGAFTGEVSATQLKGVVDYALVGHSERRHIFRENDKDIRAKVQAAIRNDISPILCVGETAQERASGETNDVLCDQLIGGLSNVTGEDMARIAIAYEPVWAIGTGKNAVPDDVKRAAKAIRSQITHLFGTGVADDVRILYGGSVSLDSASGYLNTSGVDGLLIGSASLDSHIFGSIVKAAHKKGTKKA